MKPPAEILRCVKCDGPIESMDQATRCPNCQTGFQGDGHLAFLDADKSPDLFANYKNHKDEEWIDLDKQFVGFKRSFKSKTGSKSSSLVEFLRYPYWRVACPPNFNDLHQKYANNGLVLALAGGPSSPDFKGWVNLDILPYPTVDVVGDACYLPFKDNSFDLIVSNSALEHIPDYQKVLDECYRVLKPGGHFYLCVPQVCGRHHTYDYWRWTIPGLRLIMKKFNIVEEGYRVGPGQFLPHLLEALVESAVTKPVFIREVLRTLALWLAFPLRFVQRVYTSTSMLAHYAHTIFAIGQKPV